MVKVHHAEHFQKGRNVLSEFYCDIQIGFEYQFYLFRSFINGNQVKSNIFVNYDEDTYK